MSCCAIALALAYQLIAAVRRVRAWFGHESPPEREPGLPFKATLSAMLRRPGVRLALLSMLTIESAVAGAMVYEHRTHLHNEVTALVFSVGGYAYDLCGLP